MVSINPNTLTDISTGSCTLSSEGNVELIRIYEGDTFLLESYLNTPVTILSNIGLKAMSYNKDIEITVEIL